MPLDDLRIRTPDDWHLHLRDGDALRAVVGATARQFRRALVMPNLRPPVTTVAAGEAYLKRIREAATMAGHPEFEPYLTLYLTDNTTAEEVRRAAQHPHILGFKLYPAGATTNSDSGVTDLLGKCGAALAEMERTGLVLNLHGEVTHAEVDVFDREARFIDDQLLPLRARYPALRIVFEHITTREAAQYVQAEAGEHRRIAASITPQHLLYNRNRIFQGGIRPHDYCLPVLKREPHREALVAAVKGGSPWFFLGTDSAPHAQSTKEASCGCAGCYSSPVAMELYAMALAQADCLPQLEAFASENGARFYGLPLNEGQVVLRAEAQTIPKSLPYLPNDPIVPLAAGETLGWRFERG